MSTSLLYSFGKLTEKSHTNKNFQATTPSQDDKSVSDFMKYMDNVFAEIKKTDKRKNFFKLLFL